MSILFIEISLWFLDNIAKIGGGIYLNRSNTATIIQSQISNNSADYAGGLYLSSSNNATMLQSIISSNTHLNLNSKDSSSMYILFIEISLWFVDNTASYGAGIYLSSSNKVTMLRSIISNNTARFDGGGVHLSSSNNATILRSIISNNTARSDGGGVYLSSSNNATMLQSIISNNTAHDGGGIYSSISNNATMHRSIISSKIHLKSNYE
eukprot:g7730.t1